MVGHLPNLGSQCEEPCGNRAFGARHRIVKRCCRHLVPSSDFFVQSYAVPIAVRIEGPNPESDSIMISESRDTLPQVSCLKTKFFNPHKGRKKRQFIDVSHAAYQLSRPCRALVRLDLSNAYLLPSTKQCLKRHLSHLQWSGSTQLMFGDIASPKFQVNKNR